MADIYLLINGQQEGPYTKEQVRQSLAEGQITNDVLAWKEGLAEWVVVERVLKEASVPVEEAQTEKQVVGDMEGDQTRGLKGAAPQGKRMNLKCFLGFHKWNGCGCVNCGKTRDEQHDWSSDCQKCSQCGKTRDEQHDWSSDCQKCSQCGKTRDEQHDWSRNCEKCSRCGRTRTGGHEWNGCMCSKCGQRRDEEHEWNGCRCAKCAKIQHDFEEIHFDGWEGYDFRFCRSCGENNVISLINDLKEAPKEFGYGEATFSEALQFALEPGDSTIFSLHRQREARDEFLDNCIALLRQNGELADVIKDAKHLDGGLEGVSLPFNRARAERVSLRPEAIAAATERFHDLCRIVSELQPPPAGAEPASSSD